MPTQPLPWFTDTLKNADEMMLGEQSFLQMNGYVDESGNAYIRPGFTPSLFTAREIYAAYPQVNARKFIVVESTLISQYQENDTDLLTLITSNSHSVPLGSAKPIYATSGSEYYIATGARILRIVSDVNGTEITGANTPANATHVAWLDGYLLAIEGTSGQFTWSNLNDPTTWSAYNFATAGGSGDKTISLKVVERQIYLIGTKTTEIWENNGQDPFARVPGGYIEVGCSAKYSVVRDNDSLYWISDKRQIVKIRGRTVEKISTPYDKVFASIYIEDCIADSLNLFGRTFLIFQFPTSNRTIVYEPATNKWMEFGEWDSSALAWLVFNYKDAFYSSITGRQYLLTTRWNSICLFKENQYVDKTSISTSGTGLPSLTTEYRSAPIKFLRRTGFIDHGTNDNKRSNTVSMRVKRGSLGTANSKLSVRWRNNNQGSFGSDRLIDLGGVGQTDFIRKLHGMGAYRARQYEIEMTDAVPFAIGNIQEDFTVLA
jgi:hypothetical protein